MPFLLIGLLLTALSVPLFLRKVPPNRWYGIRTAATFADEDIWYEANALLGRDMLIAGVLQVAAALFAPFAVNLAVLLGGAIYVGMVGMRRANRMLRERR